MITTAPPEPELYYAVEWQEKSHTDRVTSSVQTNSIKHTSPLGRITLPSVSDSPFRVQSLFSAFNNFLDSRFSLPINVRLHFSWFRLVLICLVALIWHKFSAFIICSQYQRAVHPRIMQNNDFLFLLKFTVQAEYLAMLKMCNPVLNIYVWFSVGISV